MRMPRRTPQETRSKDEVVRHLTEVADALDQVVDAWERTGMGLDPDRESVDVERLDGVSPEPPPSRPDVVVRAMAQAYRRSAELARRIEAGPPRRRRRARRRTVRRAEAAALAPAPAPAAVEERAPTPV